MNRYPKTGTPKILCIEQDSAVRESSCAVLQCSGYDALPASPQLAEIVLSSRHFDLLVLSLADDYALNRIINLAGGAEILSFGPITMPMDLLSLVAEKLRYSQERLA